jgi:hypothetical protein
VKRNAKRFPCLPIEMMAGYPPIFLFRSVLGAILKILNRNDQAVFLFINSRNVEIPYYVSICYEF